LYSLTFRQITQANQILHLDSCIPVCRPFLTKDLTFPVYSIPEADKTNIVKFDNIEYIYYWQLLK